MQTNVKITTRAIRVDNDPSTLTLKIDKAQLITFARKLSIVLLFAVLGVLLFVTYGSDGFQFWPLVKVTAIIGLITFVALMGNRRKFPR